MAEDFQARIGASNSWNLSKSAFTGGSPPCLTGYSDIGDYGWSGTDMVGVKGMFYEEPNLVSGISFDFPSAQKAQILDSASGGGSILIDSDCSTMGFSLSSSPTSDWNQILLSRGNGRTESSLKSLFLGDMATNVNYQQEEPIRIDHHRSSRIRKDWSPNDFSTIVEDDNSIANNTFKSADQDFYTAERCLNSDICSGNDHNFSAGYPIGSASYGQASTLLQNLLNAQTQQSSFLANNRSSNSSSSADFGLNCDESSSTWPKVASSYQKTSKSQHQNVGLCFPKNTPFWNSSSSAAKDSRAVLSPSSQSQLMASSLAEKPKCHNLTTKKLQLYAGEDVQQSGLIANRLNGGGGDLAFKRPRIETPSPLPTFKVRKEKLGDRITALQQLVSPFGKTDTASVLHEAIDYIKFLHEQVSVLSIPYMKTGASDHHQKEPEEATQELRNRGLCLVPISSTFAAASETTPELWTPTFGATFN